MCFLNIPSVSVFVKSIVTTNGILPTVGASKSRELLIASCLWHLTTNGKISNPILRNVVIKGSLAHRFCPYVRWGGGGGGQL